jgi:hypothetical protein
MKQLYKPLYEAYTNYCADVIKYTQQLQFEMRRISKLWDKTETMRFTLFSKKEILKLQDDEIYEFQNKLKKRTAELLISIDAMIKSETAGSNE